MTDKSPNSSTEKYPTFRSGRERFALGLVLLVVLGIPLAIFGYQRLRAAGPMRTIEITARLPTSDLGGWTPEVITVQKGERVRLRLTSADVVHGFAVPKLGIDAEHPGENAPELAPDAANGARLWQQINGRPAAEVASQLDLRHSSPSDVYALFTSTDLLESKAMAALTPAERWDVIAHLWRESTTPEALLLGAKLYKRDCTGCHGLNGKGDGPGAAAIKQQNSMQGMEGMEDMPGMDKPAVDFTDLTAQAGASDLLYYGKLVRGGMGTSMPYWGTIYTEDELWAVIAHLRSLAFQYPPQS